MFKFLEFVSLVQPPVPSVSLTRPPAQLVQPLDTTSMALYVLLAIQLVLHALEDSLPSAQFVLQIIL